MDNLSDTELFEDGEPSAQDSSDESGSEESINSPIVPLQSQYVETV